MKNLFIQRHKCMVAVVLLTFFLCLDTALHAQSLSVNTTGATANPSSILDVSSSNKGMLIPRVALTGTSDVATIASPATSLLVYNTATVSNVTPGYYYWSGAAWTRVLSGSAWSLTGNSGTSASTNFIGTTDNVPLIFKINNQKAGLIDVASNVFLGYQAGNVNNSIENTGIGYQALNSNDIGSGNTAVGTYSLASNTGGTGNTASGAWALTYNTIGAFNSAFGNFAQSHNSTGNHNSGFGAYALDGGPFVTGDDNTAAGFQSMKNAADGNKNSAFGTESLHFNSGGSENTAVGYQAMFNNFSSSYNTAVGVSALRNNGNNANYNVANGYGTLLYNSGSYNTAMGYASLSAANTGSNNTAIGNQVLPYNSSGNNNTGVGNMSLAENNTGTNNTAVGYYSLRTNHAGNDNVGIGNNAMASDMQNGNTGVGTNTGLNANNIANCTFIGYQAGNNSGNLTNATAIGANAVVTSSNSLVLGDYTNISVGIGVTSPSDVLHVKGIGEHQLTIEAYAFPVGLLLKSGNNEVARIRHENGPGGYLQIQDNAFNWSEIGLVLNQGSVGIGTTGPTAKLSVNGTANNSTGTWGVFSDARVKTINNEFTDGLNVIKQIRPVLFTYNEQAPYRSGDVQVGVVAQELEKVAPYMVSQKKYGEFTDLREVNNQAYVFLLINAVKEQQTRIEELEKTVKELSLKVK
ncbi:MAG TPA: hypothetical protein DCQ97_06675 [Chitinophagaceae bacterium]|nr:hypothetical protein [Chitinophagaceae bacterium]